MRKIIKFAAMLAVSLMSVYSFVSCDDDDAFESKKFKVTLPTQMGTGYEWVWANKEKAAADSLFREIVQVDSLQVGGPGYENWNFQTKEKGEKVLKFKFMRPWEDESTAIRDTLINF